MLAVEGMGDSEVDNTYDRLDARDYSTHGSGVVRVLVSARVLVVLREAKLVGFVVEVEG